MDFERGSRSLRTGTLTSLAMNLQSFLFQITIVHLRSLGPLVKVLQKE
jgi:hypothetical protein